ncbi:Pup--protein ligase [Corynebacterium kozikiae]|uniref:Pup--protein ligase n=1 Tax=Corynebacterium kozikiae TaxID=2968469 RepID=UPI00211C22A0|nr:Pup--protein ligase [Corynebacterium sp. 76QC2CO]MCQ9342878.1 Pup--protein ligase [Corynebacterium sp. 76QC2CO]
MRLTDCLSTTRRSLFAPTCKREASSHVVGQLWGEAEALEPDAARALTRRIVGVETEYGITCVAEAGERKLGADAIARYMFRPIVEEFQSSNIFVSNASRLYLDVGSHPEYATAECDSPTQLLAYEKAGDVIVNRLAEEAERALGKEGIGGQVYLFKNNLDSFGNSYGCHENYLVSRSAVLKTLGKSLLPFLITRQLLCGAGSIQDGVFQLSQRADHVWEGVSSATTRSRPIINTRDEPHADSHRFRRLHVIVGDSNMAEPSTWLKVGSTFLVLEMIEAGYEPKGLELANEMQAIRDVSRGLPPAPESAPEFAPGATPAQLVSGEQRSAVEIQRAYLDAAKQWLGLRKQTLAQHETEHHAELERVVALWEKVVSALERGDLAALAQDVDWAIKLNLLRSYQQRLGLSPEDFSHPKLRQVDLAYHDIRPGRGLFSALEAKGLVHRILSDSDILHAVDHAPSTTRATLRGRFLQAARQTQAPVSVDWLRMMVARPEPQIVELGDPFLTEEPQVDALIEYMLAHHNADTSEQGT